ncbi:hypothetical protein [Xanthobacter variabilis]|uniref:hypothetical protein n=1 Tax=Xanthobacter variabilis TaxID=3119932 RepID=UPI00374E8DD1
MMMKRERIRGMATSGDLIKAVAEVLGIPEATATTYYRSLREGGLVTKGGRGPSAARMTSRDAAHLLIAVGGARFEKDSAEKIVRDFARVEAFDSARRMAVASEDNERWNNADWIEGDGTWIFEGFVIPEMQSLPYRHHFVDALVAVIEAAMAGTLKNATRSILPLADCSHGIEICFYGPEPHASISIDFHTTGSESGDFRYSETVEYQLSDQIDKNINNYVSVNEKMRTEYCAGDLEIKRSFTWRTIYKVADTIIL